MKILWPFLFVMALEGAMSQNKRNVKQTTRPPDRKDTEHASNAKEVVPAAPPQVDSAMAPQQASPVLSQQPIQRPADNMKLLFLKNTLVTCNDGTAAGFYLRETKWSKRWLIFLEGGLFCFSKDTCDMRYKSSRKLMSSSEWSQTRKGSGILSAQQEENPYWWNANVVYVPYCSSDMWSGTLAKSGQAEYAFMGSLIIQEVIKDLAPKGIKHAKIVMLAGISAGGFGVLLNIDRVAAALEEIVAESVQVRGVVDSGWFLDLKPLNPSQCVDALYCSPIETIKKGLRLWSGILPDTCRQQFKKNNEWQCLMGDKLHPFLKTPIFVVQWLFDEEQLKLENIHFGFQSLSERLWNSMQTLGREIKNSLGDLPAVFAPACFSHVLITKSNWLQIVVKGHSVARALQCWERSLSENNKTVKAPIRGCSFHLIDNCQWPQCNPTCPPLQDPITGKEISFRQVLQKKDVDYPRKGSELQADNSG
ncbi:hypothetical protein NDU88_002226 [Pleurodeles waltl]|uniref:Uncharacterized protein n=1 Tax=Pleurodeles waltl TaxID=8319 RepID=A0AAV7M3C1_PLEWA|nr:hypothetical protein NDU88_002226 [Pleurodeles waltl]